MVHGLRRQEPAAGSTPRDIGGSEAPTAGPSKARPVTGGPRVAFVAPRTCGSAVRRNRARRQVQEALRGMVQTGALAADVDLVVRFLPEATAAGSAELAGWLASALRRLGVSP